MRELSENRKWYSVELKEPWAMELRKLLKKKEIEFDTCGAYEYVHFSVLCTEEQTSELNQHLCSINV